MSLPLKDFRVGITEEIDIFLEAEAQAFGRDKASLAREILHAWARRKAHAYKLARKRFKANRHELEADGDSSGEAP